MIIFIIIHKNSSRLANDYFYLFRDLEQLWRRHPCVIQDFTIFRNVALGYIFAHAPSLTRYLLRMLGTLTTTIVFISSV